MIDSAWEEFNKRLDNENAKYWTRRTTTLEKDSQREHKGVWFLGLSIISVIGGFAGLVYGLAGKDWIQKPYVMMSVVLILFGLSIIVGGFGKVKE